MNKRDSCKGKEAGKSVVVVVVVVEVASREIIIERRLDSATIKV